MPGVDSARGQVRTSFDERGWGSCGRLTAGGAPAQATDAMARVVLSEMLAIRVGLARLTSRDETAISARGSDIATVGVADETRAADEVCPAGLVVVTRCAWLAKLLRKSKSGRASQEHNEAGCKPDRDTHCCDRDLFSYRVEGSVEGWRRPLLL